MRLLLAVAVAAAAWPQSPQADPARREKARELLDQSAQMAGTAPPQVHVMAMMDVGAVYHAFDKEKSIYYLRHAFGATSAVPEDDGRNFRTRYQAEIVKRLAEVSMAEAADMLRAMSEPGRDSGGGSATRRVVEAMLARDKPDFDGAMEVVNLVPESAEYAFDAAERLFRKLPQGDPRRSIVFGNALSAYRRRSTGTAFPHMLAGCWRALPRESAQAAVSAVVSAISERADDPNSGEAGFSTNEEGTRRAHSRKAKELLELIHVVREFDPKRAKELLAKYPEIADAPAPQEANAGDHGSGSNDDPTDAAMPLIPFRVSMNLAEMQAEMEAYTKTMAKAEEARTAMAKDPARALALAAEIVPRLRASLLATLAEAASGKDAALGRSLLEQCAKLLSELKDPADRALPWAKIAEAAHKLKHEKLAMEALQHALDDVAAVYAQDTDGDMPNLALPDQWPSIVGCRLVMWSAAKALGAAAESLLPGIGNPDLALLARVELARALLDQRRREWSIQWNYATK